MAGSEAGATEDAVTFTERQVVQYSLGSDVVLPIGADAVLCGVVTMRTSGFDARLVCLESGRTATRPVRVRFVAVGGSFRPTSPSATIFAGTYGVFPGLWLIEPQS